MSKIFHVTGKNAGVPGSTSRVYLSLPATPYQILDAFDKLRADENSSVKFKINDFLPCPYELLPLLDEQEHDPHELNALAQKISQLDSVEMLAFHGLLRIESAKDHPIDLPRCFDIAYSTGCCHVVIGISNDAQLGRFCAESGLIPRFEHLPDHLFNRLDFEGLGRSHRQDEGGALVKESKYHPGGYVEQHSDLVEAYKTLDVKPVTPDHTILLEVSKGFFDAPGCDSDKTVQLKLPASPEALDAVLDELDIRDWREAGWNCLDCKVPSLTDTISDGGEGIDFLDHMARRLADMEPKTLAAYKALLSAIDCKTLQQAGQLMDELDNYTFSPEYSSPVDVAKGELSVILRDAERDQIVPHLDLNQYGQALIQRRGCALTAYGLIERKDGQPIQTMEQEQGGMHFG